MAQATATAATERRTENVQFRASETEKRLMERAAKMDGKPYTTWIREVGVERARRRVARG